MSKKYFDKLMTGSGATNKKVKSKFGEAMLKKMGWSEGKGINKTSPIFLLHIHNLFSNLLNTLFIGIGKNETGVSEWVQIKRREENLGLGKKDKKDRFKWDDQFWVNMYDNVAKKLTSKFDNKKESKDTTSDSSEEINEKTKIKKEKMKQKSKSFEFKSKKELRKLNKSKRKEKMSSFKVKLAE